MSNSCLKEAFASPYREVGTATGPTAVPQWHTAVHVVYDGRVHAVQFETLAEIRATIDRIGEILVRSGIRMTRPNEVFEVQARVTFLMQQLSLSAVNSDGTVAVNDDQLDHPRRFGFL